MQRQPDPQHPPHFGGIFALAAGAATFCLLAPLLFLYRRRGSLIALQMFSGMAVVICFAVCGMWRLARFNVNASVVHGYFMGLAIPAGGNCVAMTTLLFVSLDVDPLQFGLLYPALMAFVGWLMVSHVHYPNFKGDGAEPVYLATKVCSLILFAGILWAGREAILPALGVAVFVTYAALGVVNSLFAAFAKKG